MTDPLPNPELVRQELPEVLSLEFAKEILPYEMRANETVKTLVLYKKID